MGWEERMAARAKQRRRYVEAEERATGQADPDGLCGFELGTSVGIDSDIPVSSSGYGLGYGRILSRQDEVSERKRCGVPLALESDLSPTGIRGIVYCMEQRGHVGEHRNTCFGSGPVLWSDPPSLTF